MSIIEAEIKSEKSTESHKLSEPLMLMICMMM